MKLKSAIAIILIWLASAAAAAGANETTTMNDPFRSSSPLSQDSSASSFAIPGRSPNPTLYEGAKWNTGAVITWSLASAPGTNEAPFSAYMGREFEGVIQQSFAAWTETTGLKFQEVADSTSVDLRFGWGKYNPASSGIVGHTVCQAIDGVIQPDGIIRMEDPSEDPIVANASGIAVYSGTTASFSQVLIHEIGHALGLADNDDPSSIMYFEAVGSKIAPSPSDAAEIRALYAPSSIADPTLQASVPEISQSGAIAMNGAARGRGIYLRGNVKFHPSKTVNPEARPASTPALSFPK